MGNVQSEDYEDVYKLNLSLLEMAKEGKWDEFIELAEVYIITLHDIIENQPAEMMQDEKKNLSVMLTSLLENEDEITKTLKSRLDVLRKDMSSLQHGKKCSKAYSSQYTSAFH
ncbi:flagellar protein FliT [Yersinia mollaretii]|nr:flagellar protein FliT [Yersinia mollaretii]MDA5528387.1 flagellar protein FliT [Yersinia mollaretii]MDR7874354.1 flagellar protein FliT [Yersinia mollaretii]WQC74710.1 flagellar protein FliT [Yersinia mollaretii]CNE63951.1 flagellar biosynthesis protein FliT [Yersinia mollaretii]CQJ26402.1 flagellar biosynthesis protein FliT [Yersinia mollaretii]